MERIWTKIIQSRFERDGPDSIITFVPECGYTFYITAIAPRLGTEANMSLGRSHTTQSAALKRTAR